MIPWKLLDTAQVPGEGGEMRLYQRGSEFSIRVGVYELMNSRMYASEDALAEVVRELAGARPHVRVLIGGLGMGFTVTAVLRHAPARAEVVVAELVPEVVRWNRGPLAPLAGRPLDDPRVTVREADVARIIAAEREAYDAILLDVDNGPAALTTPGNSRLYSPAGLRAAFAALTRGGVLAVWSAGPHPSFTRRLKQAGFDAEEVRVRGRGSAGGPRHVIWIARRP